MTVVQSIHQLVKNFPNNFFVYVGFLLNCSFNLGTEITTWTVLHDNVHHRLVFLNDSVIVLDNVFMIKFFENVDFRDELLSLCRGHFLVVYLFPDHNFAIWQSTNFLYNSKWALSYLLYLLIFLHRYNSNLLYSMIKNIYLHVVTSHRQFHHPLFTLVLLQLLLQTSKTLELVQGHYRRSRLQGLQLWFSSSELIIIRFNVKESINSWWFSLLNEAWPPRIRCSDL